MCVCVPTPLLQAPSASRIISGGKARGGGGSPAQTQAGQVLDAGGIECQKGVNDWGEWSKPKRRDARRFEMGDTVYSGVTWAKGREGWRGRR